MGGFDKKTIRDIDVAGKHVLMRADYNVPLADGRISEGYRIEASVQTIQYLLDQKVAGLVIIAHLGRPEGRRVKSMSLKPVAERLAKLLGKSVSFAGDCIGPEAETAVKDLKPGGILLLENLRFHPGEEANDADFAKDLAEASGADLFVQDGFGVVHRQHASTDAIATILPSVAGLLLEKEVDAIDEVMAAPTHPLTVVLGGAKVSDKIELLDKFIDLADCLAIGGAMANTFLLAKGYHVGESNNEPAALPAARKILAKAEAAEKSRAFQFLLPTDVVVSTSTDGTKPTRVLDFHSGLADIESYPKIPAHKTLNLQPGEKILDIGPASAARIAGAIQMSRTVIWNGTCGITETKGIAGAAAPFGHGTRTVVDAMIGASRKHANRPFSFAGGGDTASYIEQEKLLADFNFVSTGGGAALELMAGHKLPGIEVLQTKR